MMLLGAMAFSSCDMDLKPVGTLDEETAIQIGRASCRERV